MNCEISNLPKYAKRKSPPIPAKDCELGTIKIGNDGESWQIVSAGKSQRWVKCGTGSTNCNQKNNGSKKINKNLDEQHFLFKGKVFLRKVKSTREKLPNNEKFYQYMTQNKGFIRELVENIAGYQMLYDKIYNLNFDKNLNLTFNITNTVSGISSDYRLRNYNNRLMTLGEVKKDLLSSINTFGDGCYGGMVPSECLYPDSTGDLLAEISVKNIKISKVNNPDSENKNIKKVSKECPPGKVLSPKGRCVIDRSKSKSTKKTTVKKQCPKGKVLSPKGRCVIDRSKSKSTKKTNIKKQCPKGKVLSPKGRCVIDRSKK